ncbi:MAG TPA: phosphatase PAP2 family protein [Methylomirabilota bacterium]|nr:phosphatase PAP2 family protein [Methylomirabilota bacterium]
MAAACFVALTAAVIVLGALPADAAVRQALLSLATPRVIRIMHAINRAGDWRVLLPGMVLLFVVFRRAREQWWLWISVMALAPIMEWAVKHLIRRPRPEDTSLGFPSGHSTAAAAFFGIVMLMAGSLPPRACAWVRGLALVMIALVGMARVILRAHWPSDVLAGIALGLALAAAAGSIATREPTAQA